MIYYKAMRRSTIPLEIVPTEADNMDFMKDIPSDQLDEETDYVKYWRQFATNMDCREIDAEHITMLGKDCVGRYVDDLLSLKK